MINNGFTPDKEDYEFCTKVDNMIIPSEGFFGISAATGGLAGIVNISKFEQSTKKPPAVAFYLLINPTHFSADCEIGSQ